MFVAQCCFAQLFSTIQLPKELNAKQKEMLDKIYKHPDTKSVRFVNIKSLLDLKIQKPQIAFSFEDVRISKVVVDIKRSKFERNGDYVWFGQSLESEDFVQMLLIKKDDDVFGTLEYNDRGFQIYGLGEGISALIEVKPVEGKGECHPISEKGNNFGNTPEAIIPCSGFGIGIIIFFTQAAADNTADLQQFARTCTEQYNSALSRSDAFNDPNNFLVLKGAEILTGFIQTTDISFDLRTFNRNTVANNRQLSSAIAADLKVLITDANYPSSNGIAFLDAEVGLSSAIVQLRPAVGIGKHTFSHEVGHLMGADHHLDGNTTTTTPFAHGIVVDVNYGSWFSPKKRRYASIMVSPRELNGTNVGGSRKWENLLNFSSPNVEYNGGIIGNTDCCNNTRKILESSERVRNLTNESRLTVGIAGDEAIRTYSTYAFEPIIGCGQAPFTSEWQVFINGVLHSTETLPNDAQFLLHVFGSAFFDGSYVDVQVKVVSNNGEIARASHGMFVWIGGDRDIIGTGNEPETNKIYPNPVSDKFVFEFLSMMRLNFQLPIFIFLIVKAY